MRNLLAIGLMTFGTAPVSAATMFLTSGTSVYQNGQVSDYIGQKGFAAENFATNKLGACVQTRPTTVVFSSLGSPVGPLPTSAGLVRGAYPGHSLPPGSTGASIRDGIPIADKSCYLAVPSPTSGALSGQISADIYPTAASPILYFGFYWGSIDPTNTLTLLSRPDGTGARTPITIAGLSDATGTFTGAQVLSMFNHPVAFNTYVSFRFTNAENFGTVTFGAPEPGFEVDNIAFSLSDFLVTPPGGNQQTATANPGLFGPRAGPLEVPEPALLGLFGLALAPLALRSASRRAV